MHTFFKWFRPAPLVQPFVYFYALVFDINFCFGLFGFNSGNVFFRVCVPPNLLLGDVG